MGLAHKTTVWKGPWCATQRFLTLLRSKGQVSITTAVLHVRLGENNVLLCHGLLWTSRAPGGFSTKNHSVFSEKSKLSVSTNPGARLWTHTAERGRPRAEEPAFVPGAAPTAHSQARAGSGFPAQSGFVPCHSVHLYRAVCQVTSPRRNLKHPPNSCHYQLLSQAALTIRKRTGASTCQF